MRDVLDRRAARVRTEHETGLTRDGTYVRFASWLRGASCRSSRSSPQLPRATGCVGAGRAEQSANDTALAVVGARLGFLLLLCTLAGGSLAVPKTALAGSVSGAVVAPSLAVPGEPATYTIGSCRIGPPAGTGTITVDASSGVPGDSPRSARRLSALGYDDLGSGQARCGRCAGQQVTITVGTAVAAGDSLSLVVSDVTNPVVVSTDETLQVSTSSDTAQAASRPYSTVGSLAVDHSRSSPGRRQRSHPPSLLRREIAGRSHQPCRAARLHPRRQLGRVRRP